MKLGLMGRFSVTVLIYACALARLPSSATRKAAILSPATKQRGTATAL